MFERMVEFGRRLDAEIRRAAADRQIAAVASAAVVTVGVLGAVMGTMHGAQAATGPQLASPLLVNISPTVPPPVLAQEPLGALRPSCAPAKISAGSAFTRTPAPVAVATVVPPAVKAPPVVVAPAPVVPVAPIVTPPAPVVTPPPPTTTRPPPVTETSPPTTTPTTTTPTKTTTPPTSTVSPSKASSAPASSGAAAAN